MKNMKPVTPRSTLLQVGGLTKVFPGTVALDGMSLDVRSGEVHALLGENGAGKSTLIKILAGIYSADSGSIQLHGQEWLPGRSKRELAFIHQDLGLVETMTVAENIAYARGFPTRGPVISWSKVREQALRALERIGADIDPDLLISQLSQSQRSVVAIARAVASPEASILVLDEPTASLQQREASKLFETLGSLRDSGMGMIYVSHRLDEVALVSDRVTVMRDGRSVLTSSTDETDRDSLVEAITGRTLSSWTRRPTSPRKISDVALRVEHLTTSTASDVSFELHEGEILALVGLEGAGQQSVGRAIYGSQSSEAGVVHVSGHAMDHRSPRRLIDSGIGIVPGKRAEEAIALDRSIRENLYPNTVLQGGHSSWINPVEERTRSVGLIDRFSIRATSAESAVGTLSGGNQQKVVLARWLASRCTTLILEDPTTGVDVGSKTEIYELVEALIDSRGSVLLISTDFEEVERIAHRALVFNRGKVVTSLDGESISLASLVGAASDSGWKGRK